MRKIFFILVVFFFLVGCTNQTLDAPYEESRGIPHEQTKDPSFDQRETDPKDDERGSFSFTLKDKKLLWTGGFADPSVVEFNQKYYMYLNRFDTQPSGVYVLSSTDGVNWEEETDIIFSGFAQMRGFVFDDTLRLYTHEQGPEYPPESSASLISYSSKNPLSFTKDSGKRIPTEEGFTLEGPGIIELRDGSYRMFYDKYDVSTGFEKEAEIYGATSSDGLSWKRDGNPSIVADGVEGTDPWEQVLHPTLLQWEDGYLMFYNSHSRIFAAYSEDGYTWEKLGYTGIYGADIDIVEIGNEYRVYYGDFSPETSGVVYTGILEINSEIS